MLPNSTPQGIYRDQMSQFNRGHALWNPSPMHSYKRVRLGDVGFIRDGEFRLLFSAGCPLGERQLGVDVPPTFEPLDVGQTIYSQPRQPGHLSTNSVRETGAGFEDSESPVPMLKLGTNFSSELTEEQGAALVTKYQTYREDAELESSFEAYTKRHHNSWVAFAHYAGRGDGIKPVIVTGVDLTRDFEMMAYGNSGANLASSFTISVPTVASVSASVWETYQTRRLTHSNLGPLSPTQVTDLTPPGNSDTEVLDEYNQSMRKRVLVFPSVTGPYDRGPDDEGLYEVATQLDPDVVSSLWDEDEIDDGSPVTDTDSGSDILVQNTFQDEEEELDVIARYIFQNSDARSALVHHQDVTLLCEPGDSTDISALLFKKRPPIHVDESGVGKILHPRSPSGTDILKAQFPTEVCEPNHCQVDWATPSPRRAPQSE